MKTKIKNLLPWAAIALTALGLFGTGHPSWVQYSAISISLIVVLGWLVSESGWLYMALKAAIFPIKLTKDQQNRLAIFLDETNSVLSYSYTYSPFYVWHNNSNQHHNRIQMDYAHYSAIVVWITDLKKIVEKQEVNIFYLIPSLSKAVFEVTKLGEKTEREMQNLYINGDLEESEKRQLKKDWDSAKTHFNVWVNSFSSLIKEINKSTNSNSNDYFRPLQIIE